MLDSRDRGELPSGPPPVGWRLLRGLALAAPALLGLIAATPAPGPTAAATGTLAILKVNPSNNPLAGATFEVHRDQPDGTPVPPPLTTNDRGRAEEQLPAGTYCIVETAAPKGYQLQPTYTPGQCVPVSPTGPSIPIKVTDPPVPTGSLQVIQTDLSGNTVAAAGAAFRIHANSTSGPVTTTLTTDGSGTATASLPAATYCVEQTAVPQGLQLAPQYTPGQCTDVTVGATATVSVADPAAPTSTPTPTPAPTPSPTAGPTGELQVVKTDTSGHNVTTPGFTFDVHVGSPSGQVIATVTTDGTGTAIAASLNPATYCLAETAAPDGYQLAPTYSPGACVQVAVDTNQGRSPTTVTVADPVSGTPSPSAGAAAPPSPGATQGPVARLLTPTQGSGGLPSRTLSAALVGTGGLFLVVGGIMVLTALRRRRRLPPPYEPPDIWYDSTIT